MEDDANRFETLDAAMQYTRDFHNGDISELNAALEVASIALENASHILTATVGRGSLSASWFITMLDICDKLAVLYNISELLEETNVAC